MTIEMLAQHRMLYARMRPERRRTGVAYRDVFRK